MNHVRGLIIISYFFSILTNFRLIGKNLHITWNLFYVWKGVVGRIAIDPLLKIVNSSSGICFMFWKGVVGRIAIDPLLKL